jgi:hypothetical protein
LVPPDFKGQLISVIFWQQKTSEICQMHIAGVNKNTVSKIKKEINSFINQNDMFYGISTE